MLTWKASFGITSRTFLLSFFKSGLCCILTPLTISGGFKLRAKTPVDPLRWCESVASGLTFFALPSAATRGVLNMLFHKNTDIPAVRSSTSYVTMSNLLGWASRQMGYGAKPEPAPVPASHVAPARSAEPDESAAQENLFAGLGALEQRSMVLLLCFVSGPPRRRNPAAANTVLSVAAHCRLSEQHVLEELDRVGSLQELETEFQLPAGLNVGTRCRELVVTSVVPDGGAAQAGLRLGDSVETIDGLRFTPGLGSQHLRTRAKEGPGTRILIRISRERCCDPFPVRPRQSGSCAPNPSPFTCHLIPPHLPVCVLVGTTSLPEKPPPCWRHPQGPRSWHASLFSI